MVETQLNIANFQDLKPNKCLLFKKQKKNYTNYINKPQNTCLPKSFNLRKTLYSILASI